MLMPVYHKKVSYACYVHAYVLSATPMMICKGPDNTVCAVLFAHIELLRRSVSRQHKAMVSACVLCKLIGTFASHISRFFVFFFFFFVVVVFFLFVFFCLFIFST